MKHPVLAIALSLIASAACSKKESSESADTAATADTAAKVADTKEAKKSSVPTETMKLALDEDGNAIPATIEVPVGSTIFADMPTTLRISYGEGDEFGVQVTKGNEFNTNLKETAAMLSKNEYGSKHDMLEQTDTLLVWKSTADGYESRSFNMLIDLAGTTWVCKQGNRGGWNEEQIAQQKAACLTLAAK